MNCDTVTMQAHVYNVHEVLYIMLYSQMTIIPSLAITQANTHRSSSEQHPNQVFDDVDEYTCIQLRLQILKLLPFHLPNQFKFKQGGPP